jgi:hypothetical protein
MQATYRALLFTRAEPVMSKCRREFQSMFALLAFTILWLIFSRHVETISFYLLAAAAASGVERGAQTFEPGEIKEVTGSIKTIGKKK